MNIWFHVSMSSSDNVKNEQRCVKFDLIKVALFGNARSMEVDFFCQ